MNSIYPIFVYPLNISSGTREKSLYMLKNVVFELLESKLFNIYSDTISILSDDTDISLLKQNLDEFTNRISFHYYNDSYDELDTMNHHLNMCVQRATVSTDATYYLVISSILPIFSKNLFAEDIKWESDINLGLDQYHNTAFILFRGQYTPFFFILSDETIKTGQKNLTLFQQYKRKVTIIENPSCRILEKEPNANIVCILDELSIYRNKYQTEILRLLQEEAKI